MEIKDIKSFFDIIKPSKWGEAVVSGIGELVYLYFDKDKKPVTFNSFIKLVVPNEEERIVLQKFCGASLVCRETYPIRKIMFLYGVSANGKSTFANCIKETLGTPFTSEFSVNEFTGSYLRLRNIGRLKNVLLNVSEGSVFPSRTMFSGNKLREELEKYESFIRSTTLMGELPAYMRNEDGSNDIEVIAPLYLEVTNQLPSVLSDDFYLVTHFPLHIHEDEMDTNLAGKLRQEASGIFGWIWEGCKMFVADYEKDIHIWLN